MRFQTIEGSSPEPAHVAEPLLAFTQSRGLERKNARLGGDAAIHETCLFQTGTNSLLGLITFVTKLGVGFTAVDPPELRELLRQLAASYAAAAE